jgi:hypothetical protein
MSMCRYRILKSDVITREENTVTQERIISAMTQDIGYRCDYPSSLEEQIVRLQYFVAHLLEKNEHLRRTIAIQCAGVSQRQEEIMKREEHETNDYEA